jgi:hypothetical protein
LREKNDLGHARAPSLRQTREAVMLTRAKYVENAATSISTAMVEEFMRPEPHRVRLIAGAEAQLNTLAPVGGRSELLGGTGMAFGRDASAAFLNPTWERAQRSTCPIRSVS